jgi:hypothetical protein
MHSLGFRGYPYHSSESKLACPAPKSVLAALGLRSDPGASLWQRKWTRSKYESEVLRKFDLNNSSLSAAAFEPEIVKLGRDDHRAMDQFLN